MSPVSIGDYVAGPNHTLPTQGAARYRGPLAVMDFIRWPSFVHLSDAEFDALAPVAIRLAEAEGSARTRKPSALACGSGKRHDHADANRDDAPGHARDADQRDRHHRRHRDCPITLPLPFLKHMIEAFTKYSGMDVTLEGAGDIEVDAHHLVEDVGLVLGAR